jgi:hypothetical protein
MQDGLGSPSYLMPGVSRVCFSAEASFAVGILLIPAGGYCVWSAWRKRIASLGLAVIPLFFGIQQISEGFVWLGVTPENDPHQSQTASLVYLFFALAFWPFWFPVFATMMEAQPARRRILVIVSLLSVAWFWLLFYPLLVDPELFTTQQVHHSINYDIEKLPIYRYVSIGLLRVLYVLALAAPFLIGSEQWGTFPLVMLGLTVLIAIILFNHAFVSVWCFFAAVLALYVCLVFYRLPYPTLESKPL